MAITLDAVGNTLTNNNNSGTSYTHVMGSGSDGRLIAAVLARDTVGAPSCTGVTAGGNAMTQVGSAITFNDGTTFLNLSIWSILSPAAGSTAIVATITGPTAPKFGSQSASYFGCSQVNTCSGSLASLTGTATTAQSFNQTPADDNCWVVAFAHNMVTVTAALTGNNLTLRSNRSSSGAGRFQTQDTNAAVTPAAATAVNWTPGVTSGSEVGWVMGAIAIAPVATAHPRSQAVVIV